jgi:CubicO group peptidase (beta-lactamase class C family)
VQNNGLVNEKTYDGDSLQMIFSSGKSVEAIAVAMLVDRKLLDYDQKISHYWPEFAKNGKENITVADLMRHEGGLSNFAT